MDRPTAILIMPPTVLKRRALLLTTLGCLLPPLDSVQAETPQLDWFWSCNDGDRVVFSSDFNEGVYFQEIQPGKTAEPKLSSNQFSCVRNWTSEQTTTMGFGGAFINYEGGDLTERWAQVQPALDNPSNKVLAFALKKPNVNNEKGRVQLDVTGKTGFKELKLLVRMYLSNSFSMLRTYPKTIDWLSLSSWWNNPHWDGDPYPFVVSVNINKPSVKEGENQLRFAVRARSYNQTTQKWDDALWREVNQTFEVPVGQWISLEYTFIEGDAETGRFKMTAALDNQAPQTIFDIHNYTRHPLDPSPDGISIISPMKLYTSAELIDYVTANGGLLTIQWDDMKMIGCNTLADCEPDTSIPEKVRMAIPKRPSLELD
ncbi:hypothetical protein O5O45_10580 [Hahella aquimaris]|uniref:hypothetical protein n=1 Tax=Hahella sp. HNIBRBA332 TaxID=3015983 RepID=UPI00273B1ACC|nr:hypothetical protein [Hahella sp. HNIBRBA332]WLQ16363.1 hypothetical protein O5O45_10580 [Hahella sp. HNIBRBA332]